MVFAVDSQLENVGSDYIVTSSVVKWGISKSHPDTHARRVKDAVKLVQIAQKMLMMAIEFAQTDYNLGGGEELDFKVGEGASSTLEPVNDRACVRASAVTCGCGFRDCLFTSRRCLDRSALFDAPVE